MKMKKLISAVLCATMCIMLLAGCSSSEESSSGDESSEAETSTEETSEEASETSDSGEKYKIGVSNAYLGNDWRQIMIKALEVAQTKEPYASKVDLTIVNSENTAEAQASAIDAMVEQGYDAILVDASSETALVTSIDRALDAGIVVVSFDSVVNEEGVYRVQTDYATMVKAWAEYLVAKCGEGAKIAVDTGMPGSTNGNTIYESAMEVFDEYNMDIVAEFASEFADGVCQEQLASVLAANPDLDGIFCQAYVESCYSALTQAGMDLIPIAAFDTNLGFLTALDNDMDVIIGNNCPGSSVVALDYAVKILDGESFDEDLLITPGMFVTEKDKDLDVGFPTEVIELGVNCWEDVPDGLDWPVLPPDFETISFTIDEIADYTMN